MTRTPHARQAREPTTHRYYRLLLLPLRTHWPCIMHMWVHGAHGTPKIPFCRVLRHLFWAGRLRYVWGECYVTVYCTAGYLLSCVGLDINVKGWSWTFSVFWFVFPFLAKLDSSALCSKCTTFSGECCPCSLPVQGLFQLILLPVHSLIHSKKVSGYLGVQLCSLVMTHYHPVVEVDQSSTSVCFTHS
jgi:hypothetical protein